MPTNKIYKFAGDVSALVLTDTQYNEDAQRLIGHQPGIARADLENKAIKQSSFIAEAVAKFIVDYAAVDVQDDQAASLVVTNLVAAIAAVSPGEAAGFIKAFGSGTPPSGYLECDGSSLLRASYPALFSAIGTAWGAADGSRFNLPDLRGRFPRGWDHAIGRDPGRATRSVCNTGGASGDNVGSIQGSEVGPHTHPSKLAIREADAWGSFEFVAREGDGASGYWWAQDLQLSTGLESRPINANVMYCIKY